MEIPSDGHQTTAGTPQKIKFPALRTSTRQQSKTSNRFVSEVLIMFVHDIRHKIMDQQRFLDRCDE